MARRSVLVAVVGAVVVLVVVASWLAGAGTVSGPGRSGETGTAAPAVGGDDAVQAAPGAASPERGAEHGAEPVAPGAGTPVGAAQRSLVRTAQIAVEVTDPAAAVREVRAVATGAGGIVAQERSGAGGGWLVLRVPADALDRTLDQVAGIGTVLDRGSTVVDATGEVVDLDARVASGRASVERLRALLARAETIGEVVAIESELAGREADLDSLTARLATLRDQVATSTVTVDLRVPGGADPDGEPPGFVAGLGAGWAALRALGAAAGFVIPFLPVVALLAGVAWWVRRSRGAART